MARLTTASKREICEEREREFPYTKHDFERVKSRIYAHAGISLASHKKDLVYNRLVRRLRQLKLGSFSEYLAYVDSSEEEFGHFVNALTTNLTSFFRESHHFDFLTKQYLPSLEKRGQRELKVWSSACSIGEEPYSIAISIFESEVDIQSWDIKIYATDIDTNVLQTAKTGVYPIERLDNLSKARKRNNFLKGVGPQANKARIKPHLQNLVEFQVCNLMKEWPVTEALDIIFCRNVMIYFDKETQNILLERMTQLLKPGGILCLGHSETPARSMNEYKLLGRTMYQKIHD
ncbi:protein-glutamate O-methyltransferase CheR [Psychrobium sp. 1_MG-2023]|uniref:CheR family methyltransferase n=1 Tax=Psychrobium sp. 1_MG-2023 TaxID=3062624 RepID=UPI000C334FE8|nr:protein-glutamate O-methyltransferase CheR [Psychrobium sp. 1_MG-2023]MDP2560150.1 protein-glutamate O-methyltransferase CheR [Psychrobium sp. 1_MG-2023]PKF56963.1 chemotaxis protein CheR [Alteromonadales bacterium alter-6D02]